MAVIDQLDLRETTLVAHDWGGAIGLGAAVARPDRFRAFVLLNTGAFPPPFIPWRIRLCRIPWLGSWCIRRLNLFARAALWMAVAKHERMTPRGARPACSLRMTSGHTASPSIDLSRTFPARRAIPRGKRSSKWNAHLAALSDRPCQLIWGMRDWCFRPACLERLLRIFPAAEVHRLADASHYVVEDAHEQIVPRMERFLQGLG